jgi:hypothetical protein
VTRSVGVVLAVGALVAATLGWRWWTHPDLLTPDNSGGTMAFGPRALAHSEATFGVTFPERGESGTTITFRAVPGTPRTPGRVVITGMDFDYAMGRADWYRRGVDHLGMHIIMKRVT